MTLMVIGYLILTSIDGYDFIFPLSLSASSQFFASNWRNKP